MMHGSFSRAALGLSLFAASACVADVGEPEELARLEQGILHGRPAGPGEQWGTVGFLMGYEGNVWVCSGTLIASDLIVTAAHCLYDQETGEKATTMEVIAGAYDIDAPDDTQLYEVERVLPHPQALIAAPTTDPTGLGARNDLALVRTTEPITQLTPVPILPAERLPEVLFDGAELVIAGYGKRFVDEYGFASEDGLHYVGELTFARATEHEFLAGGSEQSDTCPGDSGGPAYVRHEGQVWLLGATSRGRDDYPTLHCGQGGIYTLVPAYADWIGGMAADPELTERAWAPIGEDEAQTRQPICAVRPAARPAPLLLASFLLGLSALLRRRSARRAKACAR